ncbi:3-hydroxyacyl-CoA dehydrogenase family protein [Algihabitans albus]|uniref:3-hydroxyacyl-CoA dehydrogenase family protein n=1 Tax=Algihabitans albus TaxID=2164067 RepID=UPI001F391EE8|nr:3-hydroxyacyl-CoA dehydrogenase family protein [Algihabitans albus]
MIIERVGVIGAGMMGTEIALVFALSGADVRLTDSSPEQLGRAVDRLTGLLDKAVARGGCSSGEAEATLARLDTASHLEEQADRQLLIEAVFEDEEVKAEVLRRLDDLTDAGAILASNTSSISISVLAGRLRPERRRRFLGMHFFSPVSRMKLVEVIPGFDTDEEVVAAAMAACRAAGKEPIRVKDVAGFAVNRLLHAFWIEANRLVEEGVASPADIDAACKFGLGHPVGPYELMDRVTNHLTLQVQEILHEAYGPRFMPRPLLKQMVRAGRDGRVTGRGWFDYGDGA